ncbi:MAG: hypothetical protein IJY99_04635 [Alphaproteobacteria bacterium]|nr:hypothetical protein [Alphaproteobacteria bacterium]
MASGEMSVEEFISFLKQNFLLAETKYSLAPRMAGLWGIPDGFAALCLQNLLIVEPSNHRLRTLRPHCDTN